ncbi:1-acyl-sn-glycerol-3-phosphate acyltransferase [Porphyromonas circumdentaria]|nr:1-acyl-sn-glycerol-3-phosphate acyltransferase [Porphyromonas circumdentaria]MBB6274932.1 1-acyl-sn-glycerol-3-phosphate acyltransferase [Porphyromonas circumdentaria]MDO4722235.1 1-acyl-sn-glycerol-3-phosphate acyltransferase [Porphyromonas circumdentaria]
MGWKLIFPPDNPKKSVICVAPHTSNADFFVGKLYYSSIGRKASFMMKKELFFFPLGFFLKAVGGIPIDRSRKGEVVNTMVSLFQKRDVFSVAITPEGTRKPVEVWKSGFYRIALQAGVPIQLARIDFAQKEVGIFATFYPTGNEEADVCYIRSLYSSKQAKYPQNFIEYTNNND